MQNAYSNPDMDGNWNFSFGSEDGRAGYWTSYLHMTDDVSLGGMNRPETGMEFKAFEDAPSILYSDCHTFNFAPVDPNGNYQSAGMSGVYFNWWYSCEKNGKLFFGYAGYEFNLLYFEYPRKRSGASKLISGGIAATVICGIIDR